MADEETRDLPCEVCGTVVGQLTFPLGTSDAQWAYASTGYQCELCAANAAAVTAEQQAQETATQAALTQMLSDELAARGDASSILPVNITGAINKLTTG